jgi:two-component system sensor kinase FixL
VDAIQIQQVILNLLRNGAEASELVEDRRGRVHLRTLRGHDDAVEVRVSDNGVGLSEGAEKSVFHQFVTTKESGMGMGLSISRSIITSHGGEMWVTRNLDHGVTFHFTIPTREDD